MTQSANSQIHTTLFRYPTLFGYAYYLQKNGFLPANPRILSFGCSTGEELLSLRHYFPTARLFGCDVVKTALEQARQLTRGDAWTTVFGSTTGAIRSHGPYDLIMANSVLCENSADPVRLKTMFPFSRFEDLLCDVAQYLAPDGVICLHNASYLAEESPDFLRLAAPVRSHFAALGYVPRFSRAGDLLVDRVIIDEMGYYEIADGADPALLRLLPNSFYTRGKALQDFRIDYSAYPHSWTNRRRLPTSPTLITGRTLCHLSEAFRDRRGVRPRHDNLDHFMTDFLPEILIQIPGATDGYQSLA